MADIKLAVFDIDGTIVDAYPAIYESVKYTTRQFTLPCPSIAAIRKAVGWGDRNLLKPFVSGEKLDAALKVYRRHHAVSLVRFARLMPGARMLLRRLQRGGVQLAVASNRPRRFSRIVLKHLGVWDYFDTVVCGDQIGNMKPHPQILQVIMRRLHRSPAETLYIGDMTVDVLTGKRARVFTVAVTTGSSSASELRSACPDKILPKAAALGKLLDRARKRHII